MCSFTIEEFEELTNQKISEKEKKIINILNVVLLITTGFVAMTLL